jgi:hypothetical protein
MIDLDERLQAAGQAFRAQPVPDVAPRYPREKRWLAPIAVAAAVALVVAGVAIVRSVTHSAQPAKPAPVLEPDRRFAVQAPIISYGGRGAPRLTPPPPLCGSTALRATANTRTASDGVVGVITLSGRDCRVDANPASLLLVDSAGKRVPVPTAKHAQTRTDFYAEDSGSVRVGFAWTGSYCGTATAAVELTVLGKPLRLPLDGPLPSCHGQTGGELVPGSELGPPGAVVPPPATWRVLKADLLLPTSSSNGPVPLTVVLTNTGKSAVSLASPCPTWVAELQIANGLIATGNSSAGDLCTRALIVRPGQPLRLTLGSMPLNSPGMQLTGARVTLSWAISGVATATASTRIK